MVVRRVSVFFVVGVVLAAVAGQAQTSAPQLRPLTSAQLSKLIKSSDGQDGADTPVSAEVARALKVTDKDETVTMRQLGVSDGTRVHAINRVKGDVAFLFATVISGEARVFRVEKDFRLTGAVSKREGRAAISIDPAVAQREAQAEIDFWGSFADRL